MAEHEEYPDATSIWNERYSKGDLACTQASVKGDPIDYTQHPYLYALSTARRVTGDLRGDPLLDVAGKFLGTPAKRMLSVGSGLGFAEEKLVRHGLVESVVAFEASPVAVKNALKRLETAGLRERFDFRSGDVCSADLQDDEFDLVFVQAAIHHFYNIDEMFELFRRVLKPGGMIIYDEYVGPDHHMYEDSVMALLNEVNDCLAAGYRYDVLRNEIRSEVPRASLEWMLNMDPSEGVHSSKILPLTYRHFDVQDRRDYGGTLMRPFFVGILPNFDFDDPKDQTVAALIVKIEEILIRYGVMPSYHSIVVGKLRDEVLELSDSDLERINYSNWSGFGRHGQLTVPAEIAVFSPANHTDGNWLRGIGILGEATLFLPSSEKAVNAIRMGLNIHFEDGTVRLVKEVRRNAGSLVVSCSGEPLDPRAVGFPKKFFVK